MSLPSPAIGLFASLTGQWVLSRSITNSHPSGIDGFVKGQAVFEARPPSSDDASAEYLYSEKGTFKIATNGAEMGVRRFWIWRLGRSNTGISKSPIVTIHFVKADNETEDYLYNELLFNEDGGDSKDGRMMSAYAEHPCGKDFYKSTYRISMTTASVVTKMEVIHEVKGPGKDYTSQTMYTQECEG